MGDKLDDKQRSVVDAVVDGIRMPSLRKPMLLLGEAGTGKSWVLREICRQAVGMSMAVICPTGVAAENLQAMLQQGGATVPKGIPTPCTAHSFFMLRENQSVEETVEKLLEHKPKRVEIICSPDFLLIIDELPMMSLQLLDKIQGILRLLRSRDYKTCRRHAWGGAWVIMSGDCFQLPPVEKIDVPHCMCQVPAFFFLHPEWSRMVERIILLETIHRQDDPEFTRFLSEIRRRLPGTALSARSQQFLHGLQMKTFEELDQREEEERKHGIKLTHLCPTLQEAGEINQGQVRWLLGQKKEARKFPVQVTKVSDDPAYHKELAEKLMKRLGTRRTKGTPLEYMVVGSKVRFTYNLATGEGVSNGTVGVIVGFDDPEGEWTAHELLLSKARRRMPQEESRKKGFPVVKVRNTKRGDILVLAAPHTIRETIMGPSNKSVLAFIDAEVIPLIHGVASTIHSSQGMTLDQGVISFSNCFDYGMGYVAFSRFKTHPSVFHCDPDALTCSPLAEEFYQRVAHGDSDHGAIKLKEINRAMLYLENQRPDAEPPLKRPKV